MKLQEVGLTPCFMESLASLMDAAGLTLVPHTTDLKFSEFKMCVLFQEIKRKT
jgi:hypothetical protein